MGSTSPLALDLDALNDDFEKASASRIIRWAVGEFGDDLLLAASFQDSVLIDLATKVKPDIEVLFIDTLDHFPETYATVEAVRARYHLNLNWFRVPAPEVPFHLTDPIRCCSDAKVAALDEALSTKKAWLSGLRRTEASTRAEAPIVSIDRRGLVKVNPIANWSDLDVSGYVRDNELLYNPLLDRGYPSIGCMPTTKPVEEGADPRSGRWAGSDKTECGIHD